LVRTILPGEEVKFIKLFVWFGENLSHSRQSNCLLQRPEARVQFSDAVMFSPKIWNKKQLYANKILRFFNRPF
jgi:hypothetical protein